MPDALKPLRRVGRMSAGEYDPDREAVEAFQANQMAEAVSRERARDRDARDWCRAADDLGFPLGRSQDAPGPDGRGRVTIWLASALFECPRVTGYLVGSYVVHRGHLAGYENKWMITHVATGLLIRQGEWIDPYTDDQQLVEHGVSSTMRAGVTTARRLPAALGLQPFGLRDARGFKVQETPDLRVEMDLIKSALVGHEVTS